jgi:hypothetical protein
MRREVSNFCSFSWVPKYGGALETNADLGRLVTGCQAKPKQSRQLTKHPTLEWLGGRVSLSGRPRHAIVVGDSPTDIVAGHTLRESGRAFVRSVEFLALVLPLAVN